jgi:predicted nucleic acid-binding protein
MSLVLDSSATLAWIFPDEANDETRRIFEQVTLSGAWVPSLWRLEIANSLQIGIRNRRIDAAWRDAVLADLSVLNITIDPDTDRFAWTNTLQVADRFRLTLYDASYLELAQRRGFPLATFDRALQASAKILGVPLAGVPLLGA